MFHSTDEELRRHVIDLPFAVVGDPGKRLYAEFGVESSPRAVLDPRAVAPVFRAMVRQAARADDYRGSRGRTSGTHADDQWSVDELLAQLR